MATTAKLQRKPDTPLLGFFATGAYDKSYPAKRMVMRSSEPGSSANIHERNPHQSQDLNIKAITQKPVAKNHYVPNEYLRPAHHRSLIETQISPERTAHSGSRTKLSSNLEFANGGRHTRNFTINDSLLNQSVKVETGKSKSFHTSGPMMQTANNLLQTRVNQMKKLGTTQCLTNVKSGEALPDAASLEKKRSITKLDEDVLGMKIRENKIYCTRDDQKYYTSNKVLMNQDSVKKSEQRK